MTCFDDLELGQENTFTPKEARKCRVGALLGPKKIQTLGSNKSPQQFPSTTSSPDSIQGQDQRKGFQVLLISLFSSKRSIFL
jgi:hypothetical protein